jgi:hypothetical protein
MTDREIGVMSGLVQTLPAFFDFTTDRLVQVSEAAVGLLGEEDGLNHAARLLRNALDPRLRETAYALGCEVVAADGDPKPRALDMLAFVREELAIDPLIATALERGVRALFQRTVG